VFSAGKSAPELHTPGILCLASSSVLRTTEIIADAKENVLYIVRNLFFSLPKDFFYSQYFFFSSQERLFVP